MKWELNGTHLSVSLSELHMMDITLTSAVLFSLAVATSGRVSQYVTLAVQLQDVYVSHS